MKQMSGEMMTLLIVVVLVVIGLAHLARSRGWFR